jgi:hypothetical protein
VARANAQQLKRGTERELEALERLVARHVRHRRDLIAEAPSGSARIAAVARAAVARLAVPRTGHRRVKPDHPSLQSIIVTGSGDIMPDLTAAVGPRTAPGAKITILALQPDPGMRREEAVAAKDPVVLIATPARIIDHIRRDTIDLSAVSTVAIDVPTEGSIEQFSADLHFIYAKFERRPTTVVLVADLGREFDLLEDLLRRPTTVADSAWATGNSPSTPLLEEKSMNDVSVEPDRLKERIDDILHAIHHDEDPLTLTKYRKYARKYTSIFNRGYVLAYLLKQMAEGGMPRARPASKPAGSPRTRDDDTEKQSIFVSIGRSKRVRSRDLITFFTSADGIGQDDIGQVKVLDNYSFVEVNPKKAQAAVDELNGKEFRGRKLTVNFARRK